jgi:NAD(P)-dependent dehydrogenase (short-subunit alcohol dehydrogenase family)
VNDFSGRTAFITGGAQGIGLGIARALAREGVRIAIADVDKDALAAAEAELSSVTDVTAAVLDVRDRQAFATVADQVEHELGPVSLLFNNAGVAGFVLPELLTYEQSDWVLGINFNGVMNGIHTFLPRMIERGGNGYIVNTASGAGLVASASGFLYTTSKFAVVGLSESLHLELARFSIGVSVLCPGAVATDILDHTEESRPGEPLPTLIAEAMEPARAFLRAGTPPDAVGDMVVAAMREGRLHILTDGDLTALIQQRSEAILAATPK